MLALYKHTERPTRLCSCRCCVYVTIYVTVQARGRRPSYYPATNQGPQLPPNIIYIEKPPRAYKQRLADFTRPLDQSGVRTHPKFILTINRNNPEPKSRNLTQLSVATGCISLWFLTYEEQGTSSQNTLKAYRKRTYYIIIRVGYV